MDRSKPGKAVQYVSKPTKTLPVTKAVFAYLIKIFQQLRARFHSLSYCPSTLLHQARGSISYRSYAPHLCLCLSALASKKSGFAI